MRDSAAVDYHPTGGRIARRQATSTDTMCVPWPGILHSLPFCTPSRQNRVPWEELGRISRPRTAWPTRAVSSAPTWGTATGRPVSAIAVQASPVRHVIDVSDIQSLTTHNSRFKARSWNGRLMVCPAPPSCEERRRHLSVKETGRKDGIYLCQPNSGGARIEYSSSSPKILSIYK